MAFEEVNLENYHHRRQGKTFPCCLNFDTIWAFIRQAMAENRHPKKTVTHSLDTIKTLKQTTAQKSRSKVPPAIRGSGNCSCGFFAPNFSVSFSFRFALRSDRADSNLHTGGCRVHRASFVSETSSKYAQHLLSTVLHWIPRKKRSM